MSKTLEAFRNRGGLGGIEHGKMCRCREIISLWRGCTKRLTNRRTTQTSSINVKEMAREKITTGSTFYFVKPDFFFFPFVISVRHARPRV